MMQENPDNIQMKAFLAAVRERRGEIEALGKLPQDIFASLKQLGLYRALVPRTLGGDEKSPADFLRLVEQISAADGSAGWIASFAGAVVYLSGLPAHRFEEFYANGPDVAFAAGLHPVQPVRREGDRLILNGRWKYASGCSGADWLGAGIKVEDDGQSGMPRMIVFPKEKATLVEDWNVMGLAGTGSFDIVLENSEIEADWSFVRGGGTTRNEPIYSFPTLPFAALNHAIVGVGAALDALSQAKAAPVRDPDTARFANAITDLLSARALVYRQTESVWDLVRQSVAVPAREQGLLRLAANNAAERAITACRAAFDTVDPDHGTAYEDVARHLRDALTAGQHAFLSPAIYEQAGQLMMSDTAPPGFI